VGLRLGCAGSLIFSAIGTLLLVVNADYQQPDFVGRGQEGKSNIWCIGAEHYKTFSESELKLLELV
jgi:hypothetical protein